MSDWTEGYFTDVGYTFGYYRELNPLYAKIALQDYNVACPEVRSACELGFGQGLSVNIHAAASTVQWYGTDFMPEQAFLSSPLSGGGIGVNQLDQLFLEGIKQNRNEPPDWAEYAWQQLSAVGKKIIKEGHTLDSPEESLAELHSLAIQFKEKSLPLLRALGIA